MNKDFLRFDKDKDLVFFDMETLNLCLNFSHNLPWQIALLRSKNGLKVDFKDYYIKWDTKLKISKGAAEITKYDQSKVDKFGVSPKEAFDKMYEWFTEADYVLGHNIFGFDLYLFKEFCLLMNKPYKQFLPKFLDTNCLAKAIKLQKTISLNEDLTCFQYKLYNTRVKGIRTNLTALGKEFEIEHDYDNLHNALVDLELNLKVWNKLKYAINI
ncbi:MAG: exonuclease domain-containing protein [Nanoarchaeota archaeon]|mgnify:CR=1 FL=1